MSDSICQEITFNASAERLFEVLLDSEQFGEATGARAQIERFADGRFSCFDDMITGRTVDAVPGVRLVQAWRVFNWEPGVYSIVSLFFQKVNEDETRIIFEHKGFPPEHRDHLETGWHSKYWEPLKAYLNR